jgi:WD40 repeat protein/serine/threonine protein kinase
MLRVLRCPRGHEWSDAVTSPAVTGKATVCPVCGAPHRTVVSIAGGAGSDATAEFVGDANRNKASPGKDDTLVGPPPSGKQPTASQTKPVTPPTKAKPPDQLAATLAPPSGAADAGPPLSPTVAAPSPNAALLPPTQASPRPPYTPNKSTGPPTSVPGYEILGVLGRGGMGVVYKARQLRLNRIVALKMILAGAHAAASEVARFRTEAEAVAQVQHPNIVQIYEVGEHEGRPYFSLEFVEGGSLEQKTAGAPQPPRQAAELLDTIARAMHVAHQCGIIHRDLKPANILLQGKTTTDATDQTDKKKSKPSSSVLSVPSVVELVPKISDFGLAKRLDVESGQTASGSVLGTPSYMAPEQALGKIRELGPATDIYALGAILYELLTGRPPFRAESAWDTLAQVINEEPIPPTRLCARVPRDLQTIALKCLQKDPVKRYPSALALADDLRCFLDGKPITTRPVSLVERGWRWCRRNPAVAALLALIALFLVGGSVAAWSLAIYAAGKATWALTEKQRADEAAQRADDKAKEAEKSAKLASDKELEARNSATLAERQKQRVRRHLYVAQVNLAQAALNEARVGELRRLLTAGEQEFGDLRSFEWYYLHHLSADPQLALKGHTHGVTNVAFSADGDFLATAGEDGTVKVWQLSVDRDGRKFWDPARNPEPLTLQGHSDAVRLVVFSRDGKRLASASEDHTVKVWDLPPPAERSGLTKPLEAVATLSGHTAAVRSVAFRPDGKVVVSGSADRTVRVWDVAGGTELHRLTGHRYGVTCVAFSPDGKHLASGSEDKQVKVWDAETGKEIHTFAGPRRWVTGVAFSPDGKQLVSAGLDGTVRVWDWQTSGEPIALVCRGPVRNVTFSPEGRYVAAVNLDQTVQVWDLATNKELRTLEAQPGLLRTGDFSADGQLLASVIFGRPEPRTPTLYGHKGPIQTVAFSPDGALLASGGGDNTVKLWDPATNKELRTLTGHTDAVRSVAFSPDGQRLASASEDGTIKVWDPTTGSEVGTIQAHEQWVTCVAYSPDGKYFVSGSEDGTAKVWDAATLQQRRVLSDLGGPVRCLAFRPDGQLLAVAGAGGVIRFCDTTEFQEVRSLTGLRHPVFSVAFSPDGQWLALGSGDKTVKVWDVATLHELQTLAGHTHAVLGVAFSPDGRRLASSSADHTVRLWDLTAEADEAADAGSGSTALTLTLAGHTQAVPAVAFSRSGDRLASASWDQTVRLWNAPRPQ